MIFQNNTSVEAYIRFTNPSTNFLKINYEYKYLNLDKVKLIIYLRAKIIF